MRRRDPRGRRDRSDTAHRRRGATSAAAPRCRARRRGPQQRDLGPPEQRRPLPGGTRGLRDRGEQLLDRGILSGRDDRCRKHRDGGHTLGRFIRRAHQRFQHAGSGRSGRSTPHPSRQGRWHGVQEAATADSFVPCGSSPSDAANCPRTAQSVSVPNAITAASISALPSRSQRSDNRMADARTSRDGSRSARITLAGSRLSIPSSVHNACRRLRGGAADSAVASAARPPPCRCAGRATAARCRATIRSDASAPRPAPRMSLSRTKGWGPPRRLVHHAPDAAVPDRLFELARHDLIAQVLGDVTAVLDDAAIHVDNVERAVGRGRQVDRTEALVGGREEFAALVGLLPAQRRPSSLTTMRLTRLPAGSATNTLPYRSAGRRSPRYTVARTPS